MQQKCCPGCHSRTCATSLLHGSGRNQYRFSAFAVRLGCPSLAVAANAASMTSVDAVARRCCSWATPMRPILHVPSHRRTKSSKLLCARQIRISLLCHLCMDHLLCSCRGRLRALGPTARILSELEECQVRAGNAEFECDCRPAADPESVGYQRMPTVMGRRSVVMLLCLPCR